MNVSRAFLDRSIKYFGVLPLFSLILGLSLRTMLFARWLIDTVLSRKRQLARSFEHGGRGAAAYQVAYFELDVA